MLNLGAYKRLVSPGLSLILLPVLLLFLPVGLALCGDQSNAAVPAHDARSGDYVGSDTCRSCHGELYEKNFEHTPHVKTTLQNGHGCESCHGPGSEHIAGGGDVTKIVSFKALSKQEASNRCLACHGDHHEHRHFSSSAHASNDVGCLDCHSPHFAKESQHLLVRTQPNLCYGCHLATKADFGKPYRHRVNEGLIECVDCHNVHGTTTVRQVRTLPSGDAVCYKCHADTRGPFVYEHVPVKTEGCISCHTPHGSTNPRFLRVSQVNLLCLQCHSFPGQGPAGPTHNLAAQYQACTLCHESIHGSNASSVFFK
jgi:DmsE family decaheme c-type cytochrome